MMKTQFAVLAAVAACLSPVQGQQFPGAPEDNGLTPKTDTIFVNSQGPEWTGLNNGNTESLGVAIANGGNIMVGWEDDAEDSDATPLLDAEAVWTLYDSAGVSLTPDTGMHSLAIPSAGWVTNKFLSYFRADGSATPGGTSWGPKIKANLFGDGMGMGATSFYLGEEVAEFAGYEDTTMGDFPSVQLLDNAGQPQRILGGVSAAYATRDGGSIRIGDWDYLSNGNIVIVGESRQSADLVDLYSGSDPANHVVFRILDPAGNVVKAETLVGDTPTKAEMWHGVGVTADGFAVRFAGSGGATVRMFDNAGNPTTTNLDLATLTEKTPAGGGGRGDSAGFHGNGKDAYVAVSAGTDMDGNPAAWVTVLSTNGTVRYSKSVADDLTLAKVDRADAAIDANGEVLVIFAGLYDFSAPSLVMGRRFDATGKALGGTFYVSEKEMPDYANAAASGPRVAWRNGQAVVVWESTSDPNSFTEFGDPKKVVAMRVFSTFSVGSLESAGLTRLVADKPLIIPPTDSRNNWEPYASVLGTTTFLVEGNTYAADTTDAQRYVVGLQPADGKAGVMVDGFYADNGQPFSGPINASRQDGNPGRVAGDTRPGAVNYMVGGEASPHTVAEFGSDNRWNLGFDRLADGRYGTVQAFRLDTATLVPTPLMKAADSANGRETSGFAAGNQISRFGGDIVCLDNGNFVSVVEDRSRVRNPDSDLVAATIFAPDGTVVKETFVVALGDIWSNVAAYQGGFAVRAKPADGTATRVIYFYDNAGDLKGTVDQAASGASFDAGRGDGTRIFGHINSPYVYLAGSASNTKIVKVVAFDARTQQFVAVADVSEGAFTGDLNRVFGAVDALNRLTVAWVSKPAGYTLEQVVARVFSFDGAAKKFTALTPSFFTFVNVNATNGIRTLQMSVAMTTKQICVAAKGEINLEGKPANGPDSPAQLNFYTVFTHPKPMADPTTAVGGSAGPTLRYAVSAGKITLSWEASASGYTLESKAQLGDANWTAVGTQNPTVETIGTGSKFYRLRK